MVHAIDGFPGREIIIKGEKYLYFGGTAYLGLQTDSRFQELYSRNVEKYGTNYGASRKANVQLSIYDRAENYLASIIDCPDCLTLSSGYLAGQMISRFFHAKGHECFFAPDTHDAVHSQSSKNYVYQEKLVSDLNKYIKTNKKSPVLFFESIDLKGNGYPDFEWLNKIELQNLILVVDDSHGLGVVGKNGGGAYSTLESMPSKELVVCGSLGKGFGIQAGIIGGSSTIIKELKTYEMFSAASPAAPAALATILDSTEILTEKRHRLKENIEYFNTNLTDTTSFDYNKDYPCYAFKDERLAAFLFEHHIVVTNFYYPTENDALVQRIVLSAHHQREDVKKLTELITKYQNK